MTATAICLAETYDRAVSKYRVSTFGDLREDRAASSLLTRPVCEVPPQPLPPSKKRFLPDTHIHCDHRSAGRALAREAGAEYVLHTGAEVAFPFHAVKDGDRLPLGNVVVNVMHTPGEERPRRDRAEDHRQAREGAGGRAG